VAGFVTAGALLPNGDVVVAPLTQGVLRWTGSTWVPLGAGLSGTVMTLIVRANGRLLAGMGGGSPAVGFYEWDGASWSLVAPLATGLAVVELPNGELVVGGSFTALGGVPFNYVARWNGSSWLPLGGGTNGAVRALTVLPNGDVLAGGDFTTAGGVPAARLARWDGSAWTQFGGGADDSVGGLAQSGVELFASGLFARIGGQTSAGLARLTTTCPATAQALGAGCSGNVVTSTLPWTGSTWRVDGSGLPNSALVCVVNGFATTSLPLASIFATAVPGCTLHVQPDLVGTVLANAGAASVQFVLPNTPSLAGTVFHHQMVPLALDGSWTVTATNSLQLTVGSF
jgi:hypothetical protein